MIDFTPALNTLLLTAEQLVVADCYEVTLQDGTVVRWSGADVPITVPIKGVATTFDLGPLILRNSIKLMVGIPVDTLDLAITADSTITIGGVPLIQAGVNGRLDGATVRLYRAYAADWTSGWVGVILRFAGTVADVDGGRSHLIVKVNNQLQLLNTQQPARSYQAGCTWTVYDGDCGAAKQSTSGSITALDRRWQFSTSIDGSLIVVGDGVSAITQGTMLQGGQLKFTSGANAGFTYPVKSWSGNTATLLRAAGLALTVGDTFTVMWGCNKTINVCDKAFNNRARFGGFPFIPTAETAVPV
jgi:uncharacterized phage protein (TIGR02218 family)